EAVDSGALLPTGGSSAAMVVARQPQPGPPPADPRPACCGFGFRPRYRSEDPHPRENLGARRLRSSHDRHAETCLEIEECSGSTNPIPSEAANAAAWLP